MRKVERIKLFYLLTYLGGLMKKKTFFNPVFEFNTGQQKKEFFPFNVNYKLFINL